MSLTESSVAEMISAVPLPAFSAPGQVVKLKLCGRSFYIKAPGANVSSRTFGCFEDLPRELKTKIWGYVANARVIIAVDVPFAMTARISGTGVTGTGTLAAGANTLAAGTDTLAAGTDTLAAGTDTLAVGTSTLAAGTDTLAAGLLATGQPSTTIPGTTLPTGEENAGENSGAAVRIHSEFKIYGAAYPMIFQVCREVKDLAGGMGYKPMFQLKGSNRVTYFNPTIDVLEIHSDCMRLHLAANLTLSMALVNRFELHLIRNLNVSCPSFDVHHDWVMKQVGELPVLEDWKIVGSARVPLTHPGFRSNLIFENVGSKVAIPTVVIPGVSRMEHHEAMASFYYWVPNRFHHDYLHHLWNLINRAMLNSKTFIPAVKLQVEYIPE